MNGSSPENRSRNSSNEKEKINDIFINDNQLSREQAIIYYEGLNWYIKDGGKESNSTNGTWLYIDKNFQILHNLTFKVGPSKLKINMIPASGK